jgi:hypothetical protein
VGQSAGRCLSARVQPPKASRTERAWEGIVVRARVEGQQLLNGAATGEDRRVAVADSPPLPFMNSGD